MTRLLLYQLKDSLMLILYYVMLAFIWCWTINCWVSDFEKRFRKSKKVTPVYKQDKYTKHFIWDKKQQKFIEYITVESGYKKEGKK